MRFTDEDYAELLGLYLGDGCISHAARTDRLRIALDAKYPRIIAETRALLERSFPQNSVDAVKAHGGTMFFVSVYCSHLTCLFPQDGDGMKHKRRIELESWQTERIKAAPWAFLRGCIRSDGYVFINRTDIYRDQPYEYLSYGFSNKSQDIAEIFLATCWLVGIDARCNLNRGLWEIRINRRDSVARLVEHVGVKS
jgi:hypothetical protein